LLRLKSDIRKYQRIIFNPKAVIILSAILYALCAMPLSVANAKTATLGWKPNTEPDLEGYVVYRNKEKPGPPYKYSDELPEDELDDPLHPRLKLTGLKKETKYYVALTAYNTAGVESSFSNEICIKVIDNAIKACSEAVTPPPPTKKSSNKSSSGGGGSGGGSGGGGGGVSCFISTASHNQPNDQILFYFLFALTIIGIGFYSYKTKAKKQ
jgi:hypothetical protein